MMDERKAQRVATILSAIAVLISLAAVGFALAVQK